MRKPEVVGITPDRFSQCDQCGDWKHNTLLWRDTHIDNARIAKQPKNMRLLLESQFYCQKCKEEAV